MLGHVPYVVSDFDTVVKTVGRVAIVMRPDIGVEACRRASGLAKLTTLRKEQEGVSGGRSDSNFTF